MELTLIEVIINCLLEIIQLGQQQPCKGLYYIYYIQNMPHKERIKQRVKDQWWQRNQSERVREICRELPQCTRITTKTRYDINGMLIYFRIKC